MSAYITYRSTPEVTKFVIVKVEIPCWSNPTDNEITKAMEAELGTLQTADLIPAGGAQNINAKWNELSTAPRALVNGDTPGNQTIWSNWRIEISYTL
jgi:hypothetical protein